MSAPDVVTYGEIMGNFVATTAGPLEKAELFRRRLAGAELNVAVALSRLGHRVGFVGRVGGDPLGEAARARLREEGIDGTHVQVEEHEVTGIQLKERAVTEDPRYVYYRRGSAGSLLTPSSEALGYVASARHLHATGIPPALSDTARRFAVEAVEAARDAGVGVSFDPNLRPTLWPDQDEMVRVVGELAVRADWVLPGIAEGETLTGRREPQAIADYYLSRGARGVAVKLGARGACLFTPDASWTQPPFPVRTVDTIGAGDGFAAGFISALLDGLGDRQRLERACAVGALATGNEGDCDGMPSRSELDALLADG
ncbi:sugar kinase [Herbidospora yilanensis]|uniref:sugar kinase n=1 Tax=Herbidospora yilanensis TaxID=354426 RepID=UPI0007844159|nr:sugar kinase [Herbidospora yilanensis]